MTSATGAFGRDTSIVTIANLLRVRMRVNVDEADMANVKPGERVGAVEDVLNQGDEIDVTVVEVDKERGRIGLRLSTDPDVEGKSAAELAGVGTGDPGPPRGGRRDGGGGRRRERDGGGRRRERRG